MGFGLKNSKSMFRILSLSSSSEESEGALPALCFWDFEDLVGFEDCEVIVVESGSVGGSLRFTIVTVV